MNAQRLLLDGTITTLPSNIIENILWLLPIEEVVRTSLLSKEWRYNWTKIPKVAFIEDLFHDSMFDESSGENQLLVKQGFEEPTSESEMKKMIMRYKFLYAIYQFLLLHQGPIVDFTLSMTSSEATNDFAEIDQLLLHLSRKNTVKKLRLSSVCDLPLSIFSFHELTDLYLSDCSICHLPPFNRFGSLTTLCLKDVRMYKKTLMHILSNNPLLKSLTMVTDGCSIILTSNEEYGTINDLFQCLPLIEHLSFYVWDIQSFGNGVVPRKLATSLVHLKFLHLERMCFLENNWFQFLVLMIKSSPNLEKLTLKMMFVDTEEDERWIDFDHDLYSATMQDCSGIWLEHLIEFEIEDDFNAELDLEFVKLILAKSPVLKKLRLGVYYKDADLKLLEALLSPPPASPMVKIVGFRGGKDHPFEIDGVIY